ncbi:MAG TPA: glycosyltransferase family 9 protein, partial [Planctomycetaceae bacterium]|nr:glycosyltransferase family 9 protein [Planctomycetaceae bacterium]
SDGSAELSPRTSITDLVSFARSARLMVSGDTGPLHIAGAVGTPIVALFGPTFPERNGPWSAADVTLSRVHECVCRYERRCHRATRCIDDITTQQVVDAVRQRTAAPYPQGSDPLVQGSDLPAQKLQRETQEPPHGVGHG